MHSHLSICRQRKGRNEMLTVDDSLFVRESVRTQPPSLDGLQDRLLRSPKKGGCIDTTCDLKDIVVRDRDMGALRQGALADTGLRNGRVARR